MTDLLDQDKTKAAFGTIHDPEPDVFAQVKTRTRVQQADKRFKSGKARFEELDNQGLSGPSFKKDWEDHPTVKRWPSILCGSRNTVENAEKYVQDFLDGPLADAKKARTPEQIKVAQEKLEEFNKQHENPLEGSDGAREYADKFRERGGDLEPLRKKVDGHLKPTESKLTIFIDLWDKASNQKPVRAILIMLKTKRSAIREVRDVFNVIECLDDIAHDWDKLANESKRFGKLLRGAYNRENTPEEWPGVVKGLEKEHTALKKALTQYRT